MVQTDQIKLPGSNPTLPVNGPPNLGKASRLPVPDFNDPDRPKVCLEVDFPIAPINALAKLEATSGAAKKPIYQMSKWYARRQSSVFRSLLISAATKAPEDPNYAAKCVWDHYYCNHQKAGSFSKLQILDLFMGGGTTIVEGNRLGFSMTGVDLNPIAWFITKNEVSCADPVKVKKYFEYIEEKVKPIIQPFFTTTCPRGHKGRWIDKKTGSPVEINPADLPPEERYRYLWNGPEIIYTFWAKHGPCQKSECNHRTPLFRTPVIAEKKFSTQIITTTCSKCNIKFNIELGETRIAPGSERVILENEPSFTETSQVFAKFIDEYNTGSKEEKKSRIKKILHLLDSESAFRCPHCGEFSGEGIKKILENHLRSSKSGDIKKKDLDIEKRQIYLFLLIHPDWLKGSPGYINGKELGGYSDADPNDSREWWEARLKNLALIEVKGRVILTADKTDFHVEGEISDIEESEKESEKIGDTKEGKKFGLPSLITLKNGTKILTRQGNIPKQANFGCKSCGLQQSLLGSVKATKHNPPVAAYALQCYCPECAKENFNYNGRYFKAVDKNDIKNLVNSEYEWKKLSKTVLEPYWPKMPIEFSMRTHVKDPLPDHGYTHWWKMFNSRQLLIHTNFLKVFEESSKDTWTLEVLNQALGAFQQYLRSQSSFSFYHLKNDQIAAALSNSNYNPKHLTIETSVFTQIGSGRWGAYIENVLSGLNWSKCPSDPIIDKDVANVIIGDPIQCDSVRIFCRSSSDLPFLRDLSYDLVITDPPFGDNVYYADLADFFYVWLRIPLLKWYEGLPERAYFEPSRTPHSVEAIDNAVEHPDTREDWQKIHKISLKHLEKIQKISGDLSLKESDPNPLYRPNPASDFYNKTLTACWAEGARVLKPGGVLAFTFHHSDDAPWVDVLESLFKAGFILVATYPIKSDETKGESAEFGSQKIEYDIIHVCRKRLEDPQSVSWAKMRLWVRDETKRLKNLLEHTHGKDLNEEDLRVILRGKALEFYSRHYGQILTGHNQNLTVPEALLGINQILEDIVQREGALESQRSPDSAEPKSRLLISVFLGRETITRDELSKRLRGTGITPDDLESMGWIRSIGTTIRIVSIKDRFNYLTAPGRNRKNIRIDLDQAHFLIGAAMPKSGLDIINELDRDTFRPKKSTDDIIRWYSENAHDDEIKRCARIAFDLIGQWRRKSKKTEKYIQTTFDMLEEEQ